MSEPTESNRFARNPNLSVDAITTYIVKMILNRDYS
jgi:hypothetical protein